MMLRVAVLLFSLLFAACSRPSLAGRYETRGSEKQFKMTLELLTDGQGKFATAANLGNPQLDRSVEASMSIPQGRWTKERGEIVLGGNRGDGKPIAHRFAVQENGDLIWTEKGARFYRTQ